MDSELKRFEEELERLSPGSLPEGLISRMEAAMEDWQEHPDSNAGEDDKVVPFPPRDEEERSRQKGSLWAAAASVAILGALAGLFFTADPDQANSKSSASTGPTPNLDIQPVEFSPQAAKRKILSASDEDLIIANGAQPLRVMRLDYVDRVVFRNANGEEVHVEVPAVKYRLVPVVPD